MVGCKQGYTRNGFCDSGIWLETRISLHMGAFLLLMVWVMAEFFCPNSLQVGVIDHKAIC